MVSGDGRQNAAVECCAELLTAGGCNVILPGTASDLGFCGLVCFCRAKGIEVPELPCGSRCPLDSKGNAGKFYSGKADVPLVMCVVKN